MPLTADKVDEVEILHERLNHFHVMIDHMDQATALVARLSRPEVRSQLVARPLSVFVGVDCGYHRDGCDPQAASSLELVQYLVDSNVVGFAGIYTHGGHSYDATSTDDIVAIAGAYGSAGATACLARRMPWRPKMVENALNTSGSTLADAEFRWLLALYEQSRSVMPRSGLLNGFGRAESQSPLWASARRPRAACPLLTWTAWTSCIPATSSTMHAHCSSHPHAYTRSTQTQIS